MFKDLLAAYLKTYAEFATQGGCFNVHDRLLFINEAIKAGEYSWCSWPPVALTWKLGAWIIPPCADGHIDSMVWEPYTLPKSLPLPLKRAYGDVLSRHVSVPCPKQWTLRKANVPVKTIDLIKFETVYQDSELSPALAATCFFADHACVQAMTCLSDAQHDNVAGHRGKTKAREILSFSGSIKAKRLLDLGGAPGGCATVFASNGAMVTTVSKPDSITYWPSVLEHETIKASYENIETISPGREYDFVFSDACVDFNYYDGNVHREVNNRRLHRHVLRIALMSIVPGGTFICKLLVGVTRFVKEFLYILTMVFDKVDLHRLNVSRVTGGEFYACARGLKIGHAISASIELTNYCRDDSLGIKDYFPTPDHEPFVEAVLVQQILSWQALKSSGSLKAPSLPDPIFRADARERPNMPRTSDEISAFLESGVVVGADPALLSNAATGYPKFVGYVDEAHYTSLPYREHLAVRCGHRPYVIPLDYGMFDKCRVTMVRSCDYYCKVYVMHEACRGVSVVIRLTTSNFAFVRVSRPCKHCAPDRALPSPISVSKEKVSVKLNFSRFLRVVDEVVEVCPPYDDDVDDFRPLVPFRGPASYRSDVAFTQPDVPRFV